MQTEETEPMCTAFIETGEVEVGGFMVELETDLICFEEKNEEEPLCKNENLDEAVNEILLINSPEKNVNNSGSGADQQPFAENEQVSVNQESKIYEENEGKNYIVECLDIIENSPVKENDQQPMTKEYIKSLLEEYEGLKAQVRDLRMIEERGSKVYLF